MKRRRRTKEAPAQAAGSTPNATVSTRGAEAPRDEVTKAEERNEVGERAERKESDAEDHLADDFARATANG